MRRVHSSSDVLFSVLYCPWFDRQLTSESLVFLLSSSWNPNYTVWQDTGPISVLTHDRCSYLPMFHFLLSTLTNIFCLASSNYFFFPGLNLKLCKGCLLWKNKTKQNKIKKKKTLRHPQSKSNGLHLNSYSTLGILLSYMAICCVAFVSDLVRHNEFPDQFTLLPFVYERWRYVKLCSMMFYLDNYLE